jgi:hypothetical protein
MQQGYASDAAMWPQDRGDFETWFQPESLLDLYNAARLMGRPLDGPQYHLQLIYIFLLTLP